MHGRKSTAPQAQPISKASISSKGMSKSGKKACKTPTQKEAPWPHSCRTAMLAAWCCMRPMSTNIRLHFNPKRNMRNCKPSCYPSFQTLHRHSETCTSVVTGMLHAKHCVCACPERLRRADKPLSSHLYHPHLLHQANHKYSIRKLPCDVQRNCSKLHVVAAGCSPRAASCGHQYEVYLIESYTPSQKSKICGEPQEGHGVLSMEKGPCKRHSCQCILILIYFNIF